MPYAGMAEILHPEFFHPEKVRDFYLACRNPPISDNTRSKPCDQKNKLFTQAGCFKGLNLPAFLCRTVQISTPSVHYMKLLCYFCRNILKP